MERSTQRAMMYDDDGLSDISLSDNEEVAFMSQHEPVRALQHELLTNWTVKNPGKVTAPTTNDYTKWTVEQLRKECAARGSKSIKPIKRQSKGEKEARIEALKEHDNDRRQIALAVDPDNALPPYNSSIRLLNILFSDAFADRFRGTEDSLTRLEMELREFNENSRFWKDVEADFNTNTEDYNSLYVEEDDRRFDAIDPSVIVFHKAKELFDTWSAVQKLYVPAFKNSTRSGEHDEDFLEYCKGRIDVAYLHVCVGVKPLLAGFVRGAMPDHAKMDTTQPYRKPTGKNKRYRRESAGSQDDDTTELRKTLKVLTSYFTSKQAAPPAASSLHVPAAQTAGRDTMEILECISKTYNILHQLKTTQSDLEARGQRSTTLLESIALQEKGLAKLEREYAARMGISAISRAKSSDSDGELIIRV